MKTVNIAIMGFGNIGVGTYRGLEINHDAIAAKTGLDLKVAKIIELDIDRPREANPDRALFTTDRFEAFRDPSIDIVAELIGGIEPATTFMSEAMKHGKHVVTANKAALAANYERLTGEAEEAGVLFRFEAAVGGGIPVINAIETSLRSNQIDEVTGILNGTTNFILTQMTRAGRSYADVLKEAQEKGFAEADPTADVEGIDAANKLSILISLCFGDRVKVEEIPTIGISGVTPDDIAQAKAENKVVKLLAHAAKEDGEIICSVAPARIDANHPLAGVSDEFNAIYLKGNILGETMFYGKGAGPLPTGGAIIGDIIDIATRTK
ncbi:MAG: homoserine dehydrogenase [Clostridiales Family XIII bacterium]|jgi:homoserine dehydrogenase|nr:homoserine dehydrogenase [Clostridiales Family XIII bacterium]